MAMLVRCAFYENPAFGGGLGRAQAQEEVFRKVGSAERLAMMRNPRVSMELISKVYDFENKEIPLSDDERVQLIRAFCTNLEHIEESRKTDPFEHEDFWDAVGHTMTYDGLWKKGMAWIERNPEVTSLTLKTFGAHEKEALEAYEKLKDKKYASCRRAIFENPLLQQTDAEKAYRCKELLAKALNDEDSWIRYIGLAFHPALSRADVERVIQKNDKWELRGLVFNRHLPLELMRLIGEKNLYEAGLYQGEIHNFMERYSSRQNEQDPEQTEVAEPALKLEDLDAFQQAVVSKIEGLERNQRFLRQNLQEVTPKINTLSQRISWIIWLTGIALLILVSRGC